MCNRIEGPSAEPERRQWVVDPRHPTGFRLVDLPEPASQPVAFFDGEIFERQFNVERRQINREQEWRLNAQQAWPPQKGPPDSATPTKICRLDGTVPVDEPDPWRLSYPPFTEISLRGRDHVTAYELILVIAGSDPYAPWWGDAHERADDRLHLMRALAPKAWRNLQRDIRRNRKICPLVEGYDELKGEPDPSSDIIDIDAANAFARRIGSDRWAALWAERGKVDDRPARDPQTADQEAPPASHHHPPGPKPGEKSAKELMSEIAIEILNDKTQRPPCRHGWKTQIARLVHAKLAQRGLTYELESVSRHIRQTLQEWETKNPDK